jgi:hypothetical protein
VHAIARAFVYIAIKDTPLMPGSVMISMVSCGKFYRSPSKYPNRNTTRIPTKQQTAGDLSVTGPISRSGSRRPDVKQFSRDAAPRVYCLAEAPSAMHCHWPLRSIHVSAQPYDRLNSFPSLSLPFSVEVPHTVATLEP